MVEQASETINFKSNRFGILEVPESSVVKIVGGIIGFPGFERYVLLEYNPPFSWFHCVDNPDLAFVVVNGAEFGEHYNFSLPTNDPDLALGKDPDIAIVNLVSVRPTREETTVNLKAPVIVNLSTRIGKQIVLDDPRFPTRLPLWTSGAGA